MPGTLAGRQPMRAEAPRRGVRDDDDTGSAMHQAAVLPGNTAQDGGPRGCPDGRSGRRRGEGAQRRGPVMRQRVHLITLGVEDLDRARAFYQALGWTPVATPEGLVAFDLWGATLALYRRADLARDMGR